MRQLWAALFMAAVVANYPSHAAAQVRPQGVDNDALRKGRARIDLGLDVDGPDRHRHLTDFDVDIKVLGGSDHDFTPGDLAAFPPSANTVSTPDSARILIRSVTTGKTWITPSTQFPLPVGPLSRRRILGSLGFVVPQLPGGEYIAWFEPGLTPDSAEHLRISPQLESSTTGGRVGRTITVMAELIGPGTIPPRADAPVGAIPYQADIRLESNDPHIADLTSDQPGTIHTNGTIARFNVALKDAGKATFKVAAMNPGSAAPFTTAIITVNVATPKSGAEQWLPMLRFNGRIHYGRPDMPAVLLVHGFLGAGGGWMGPGEDVGNSNELNWSHGQTPANKSMGDGNWYPGVGVEGFGLSGKSTLTNDEYFFNYLVSRGFTIATWDQPGTRYDTALVSARLALAEFLRSTRSMTHPPPVALIGHSRGGLIIRHLLIELSAGKNQLDGDAARIAWVITLSTPHKGTIIGPLAADVESALGDLHTYHTIGLPWPFDMAARDEVVKAMQPYLDVLRGCQELTPDGPVITFLNRNDRRLDGIHYYTFAGTSPTMFRLYEWDYTASSAAPHGNPPRFSWIATPSELRSVSPLVDRLPTILPPILRLEGKAVPAMKEFTMGQGDGAVAVSNANLPWSTSFKTFPVNHAEMRWTRAVQDDVYVYLTQK